MLIIGINGSPQKDGNTARLLADALKIVKGLGAESKIIHVADALAGLKVPFCHQCTPQCDGRCSEGKPLREAYELMQKCGGMILGSPVYFGTVSAQLKAFWDKSRYLRKEKALLNVIGGGLTVGAGRFGGQETTLNALYHMMLVQGMTIVGDGFGEHDCGHLGAAGQKPVENDGVAWERARILAKRVYEVAAVTEHLRSR